MSYSTATQDLVYVTREQKNEQNYLRINLYKLDTTVNQLKYLQTFNSAALQLNGLEILPL